MKIANVSKIAILHAKALGDFVVIQPALRAIKQTYPSAELVLLARSWAREYLQGRPSPVDKVIEVPSYPGVNNSPAGGGGEVSEGDHDAFFQRMQQEQFDVAIQMQGGGRFTNPFIKKLGAKVTVGMQDQEAEGLNLSIPYVYYQNEIMRNLEIVSLIGAATEYIEPELNVTDRDIHEAAAAVPFAGKESYVVIHPGADDIRRLWPVEKFAVVANQLQKSGYRVVLTGTPKEADRIHQVALLVNGEVIECSSLSIGGLSALLSQCALYLSSDTGPLHVARAVGAKTIGLFWQPNLLNWGPLTRGRHRVAISWKMNCPQCGILPAIPWPFQPVTAGCDHPFSFIEEIETDEVLRLASELLHDKA